MHVPGIFILRQRFQQHGEATFEKSRKFRAGEREYAPNYII